ncbi:MAG: hypothetical protein OXB88_05185 [Bacteriovoracales bacterium]|nr:hypothetical protein [Bacteriovoracales bacterium]
MLKATIIILYGMTFFNLVWGSDEGLGADLLMQSSKTVGKEKDSLGEWNRDASLKLNNPFIVHFYTRWNEVKKENIEQNLWAGFVLNQKWEKVAHLWSVTKRSVNNFFDATARTAYLFALWKLELGQSFWNEWFEMLRVEKFRRSKAFTALNLSIQKEFPQRFYDWGIAVEMNQAEFLFSKMKDKNPIYDTIRAHLLLRNVSKYAQYAEELLLRLPGTHPLYVPLAKTLALHFARLENLGKAGSILKKIESHILKSQDPEAISSYHLQIARLLYQSGNLEVAGKFYQKIPKGSKHFLTAREELAWVLLQSGEFGILRGELRTFRTDIWKDRFLPEIHLVSAIGNLKLCFYGEVRKDISLFLKKNRKWATRIENELKKPMPSKPNLEDFYIHRAEKALSERLKESRALEHFAKESLTAALPAVGVQPHWIAAKKSMGSSIERAQKKKAEEYKRVWHSYRFVLEEAIRKMRFVKVELMHQVSNLAAHASGKKLKGNIKTKLTVSNNSMAFPFDGVVWPDEMFNLQSLTEGKCL